MLPALRKLLAPAPPVRQLWVADPGTRRTFLILAWIAFGFGAHLLISWPDRFTAPTYATIRESGGIAWGYIWLALAAALGISRSIGLRASYWALQAGGLVHFVWAAALTWAAISDQWVAGLGTILFTALGVLHVSTALEHRARAVPIGGAPDAE